MSGFGGRRAPNVSQYIANLNALSPVSDVKSQGQEDFGLENDLAMFTNTQFFDFDLGEMVDAAPVPYDPAKEERARRDNATTGPGTIQSGLNFLNDDYQYPDFPSLQNLLDGGNTNIVTSPTQPQNTTTSQYGTSSLSPPATTAATSTIVPQTGDKRTADTRAGSTESTTTTLEEASRIAAEEDKRRRNTAASARFRVKKKQREQTLEKTAKEMTDKVSQLESRIGQLETENKWLKNLITEKNENKDDIADLWRKFNRQRDGDGGVRSTSQQKDGVGTTEPSSSSTTTTTTTTTS